MSDRDELSPARANRIADAVEAIERDVVRLAELQHLALGEYVSDGNQDTRDVVERKFEKLTEATLDIARQEVSRTGAPTPVRIETPSPMVSEVSVDSP